jgi:hypothetical protein
MEKQQTVYTPESKKDHISLTEEQKNTVRNITLGIEEVDETVRSMAIEDVIHTLENGHPLNRIITDQEEKINGYIACEDFIPHEAYLKYLGTTKQTGRNLLQEIPAFLEYAKQQGYTKLNFHGWNDRLNHILERYGFKRVRTDSMAGFSADFYEKILVEQKPQAEMERERVNAFEQKYINKINQEYQQTLATFLPDNRPQKEQLISETFQTLSRQLTNQEGFEFNKRQQAVLKLKLARHFQNNETIDTNVLFDAIIETPNFINTDKGSLYRLLEVHEEKTLQKIAEIRKQKAEIKGNEKFNPYEALFETKSGNYYMARLLNMPHLEEESQYMNHCVGTSDSYVNKIKRGEVEILSFRNMPKINFKTQKLEADIPVITLEYNLKTKIIEQMKKNSDQYLSQNDPYFNDIIDALKQLRRTKTDTGELRDFKQISLSELQNFKVKDYHILTENGEILFRDFNPDDNAFVLKMGLMDITSETSKTDASKIMKIVEGIECDSSQIAYGINEVNENTKAYIGEWNSEIMKKLPENIEYLYELFPEKKILRKTIELTTKTSKEYTEELLKQGYKTSDWAQDILNKVEPLKQKEEINIVSFSVEQLGFSNGATLQEIYNKAKELGLELCPPQVGPELRLNYKDQPNGEYLRIAMESISDSDDSPRLFGVHRYGSESWLDGGSGGLGYRWDGGRRFVFRFRK